MNNKCECTPANQGIRHTAYSQSPVMPVVRFFAGLFVLLFGSASLAEDPAILHIREEYQSIQNALPRLKSESFDLEGYSTEGGEAKAFLDSRDNIRLIKVQLFGETGKVLEEFFYENGLLIFAFYQTHQYNAPIYSTPETAKEIGSGPFDPEKTILAEDRYYFDKGKMIRWLDKGKSEVKPGSREFKESEKEIMDMSNEMLSKLR